MARLKYFPWSHPDSSRLTLSENKFTNCSKCIQPLAQKCVHTLTICGKWEAEFIHFSKRKRWYCVVDGLIAYTLFSRELKQIYQRDLWNRVLYFKTLGEKPWQYHYRYVETLRLYFNHFLTVTCNWSNFAVPTHIHWYPLWRKTWSMANRRSLLWSSENSNRKEHRFWRGDQRWWPSEHGNGDSGARFRWETLPISQMWSSPHRNNRTEKWRTDLVFEKNPNHKFEAN